MLLHYLLKGIVDINFECNTVFQIYYNLFFFFLYLKCTLALTKEQISFLTFSSSILFQVYFLSFSSPVLEANHHF